jgi:hypothetical protein
MSCDGTSQNKVGLYADKYKLFWEFTYPQRWNQASSLNARLGGLFHPQRTTKCTSSQDLLLLTEFARWFCEPEFSCLGTNAAVLLQFALKIRKYPRAVHVERMILLITSPVYHQFPPVLPHLSPTFSVLPRCLKWRLLLENFHFFVTCAVGKCFLNLRRNFL